LKFARSKETVPTSEIRPSPHFVPWPGRSGGALAYLAFRRQDAIQEGGSVWELPARRESERDRHREKHTAIFHAIGSIGKIRA